MEHFESARSLVLFLMIYLLTCRGNFGATQGEQKHCYNHSEGNRKKTSLHVSSLSFYFNRGIL